MPARSESVPTSVLLGSGGSPDAAAEIFRRLSADPDSTIVDIRRMSAHLDIPAMSWIGVLLAESAALQAHRMLLEFWANALDRLDRSLPDLPPWPLAGWTWDSDEQAFFGALVDVIPSDWSCLDIEDVVVDGLRDSSVAVRSAAADLAGTWNDRSKGRYPLNVERALIAALSDPEGSVRERCAWALSLAPTPDAREALLRLAADGAGRVRAAAVAALGQLEDADTRFVVLSALRDPHPWVRIAALHALEVSAPEIAQIEADQLVNHDDPWVAGMALATLSRIRRK